jgi:sulfite reductase alpha subunit-like flavoprotein
MNAEFTAIVQALIAEQGKDAIVNPARCKAFLPDYTKSEFTKERRLLLKVVETGAAKEIASAADLDICKKQQVRYLKEELFIAEDVAVEAVDMLAFVLRGETTEAKPEVSQPASQKPEETLYNISFNYQQSGPYTMSQLLRMAESGQLTKDHWICPAGTSEWVPSVSMDKLQTIINEKQKTEIEPKPVKKPRRKKAKTKTTPAPRDVAPVNGLETKPGESKRAPSKYENPLSARIFAIVGIGPLIGICLLLLLAAFPSSLLTIPFLILFIVLLKYTWRKTKT